MKVLYLKIAELCLKVTLESRICRLPDNYTPFLIAESEVEELLSEIFVGDACLVFEDVAEELIAHFEDLGFVQEIYKSRSGGYVFQIYDTDGALAAVMSSDAKFLCNKVAIVARNEPSVIFGLNNMLMVAFAFSSAYRSVLTVHSSVVVKGGWGYMFLGRSGTGKSTHTSLWLKNISDTSLLNDDNPVVRIVEGNAIVYGSPWSGKTPCYKQEKVKVGACVMLEQKPYNRISRQDVLRSFSAMMSSCSLMVWDSGSYDCLVETITLMVSSVPMFRLECLPDEDAAMLSYKTINRNEAPV